MGAPTLVVIDPVTAGSGSARPMAGRLRPLDPATALVCANDLGVTRGDGVFESISIVDGHPHGLDAHLARLQHSASILELPELDLVTIEAAVRLAAELHDPRHNLLVKVVVTRGIEGVEDPTAWAYAAAAPDYSREQGEGVRAVSLDRGYRSDVSRTSPWLLAGAKTLSYAINKAALREARRRGANDVIFVSSDGFVLEGPTSSIVARFGKVCASPATDQGILAGTTQARAFELLTASGFKTVHRPISRAELEDCDALWLLSSGRKVVPVVALDNRPITVDRGLTAFLLKGLMDRRETRPAGPAEGRRIEHHMLQRPENISSNPRYKQA